MNQRSLLSFALFLLPWMLFGQSLTQTIKGKVIDKETHQPLPGASIILLDSDPLVGTTADEFGRFALKSVPVGKRVVQCQFLGYSTYESDELEVSTGKAIILDIKLSENPFYGPEVVVYPSDFPSDPINSDALVSGRSFTTKELDKIPASVNDPGRMALSFPGVQQGIDENENKIIVRGNSSVGVLWRLEGIDIPNPNHFATPGTSGGAITIFSAQLLDRSDFFTGAFSAEYGNALSGVFDMHFRQGNKEQREHRIRLGLIGLDGATEGPIRKGASSYLFNYRFSTLQLLNALGFNLVGERVDNNFQDLSFNLAFEGKEGNSEFTIFGISGISEEHHFPVENPADRDPAVLDHWEDRINKSKMGALGLTYTKTLNERSYLKAVVAGISWVITRDYDTLSLSQERVNYDLQKYRDERLSTALSYHNEVNEKIRLTTGFQIHQIFYHFFKETLPRGSGVEFSPVREISIRGQGNTQSFQSYCNINYQLNERLEINTGLHGLFFTLNNSWSLEPRFSFRFRLNQDQQINFGYGLHSKILPFSAYFYDSSGLEPDSTTLAHNPNHDLSLIKAHHLVLGYNNRLSRTLRFSTEVYYQRLFNVPVGMDDREGYWMLNDQGRLLEFPLVSDGKGTNYGIDLALEKKFANKSFFLITASAFDSKYEINGVRRNTRFNTRFVSTISVGREFEFKNNGTLEVGFRFMANGGFRYSPYDPESSLEKRTYVPLAGKEWSEQVANYYRLDGRLSFRKSKAKYFYALSLDIQNMTNRFNPHSVRYNASTNSLDLKVHTGGIIPVLSYFIDF